jgi:hypothetical protein
MPHHNLSDEVNRNIAQSEIEGGVHLDNLSDGDVLVVETQNRWYAIMVGRRGKDLIWGHPKYCPEAEKVANSDQHCTSHSTEDGRTDNTHR